MSQEARRRVAAWQRLDPPPSTNAVFQSDCASVASAKDSSVRCWTAYASHASVASAAGRNVGPNPRGTLRSGASAEAKITALTTTPPICTSAATPTAQTPRRCDSHTNLRDYGAAVTSRPRSSSILGGGPSSTQFRP